MGPLVWLTILGACIPARAADLAENAKLIGGLLARVPGVQVTAAADSVVLDGEAASMDELERVLSVQARFEDVKIRNLVVMTDGALAALARTIQQEVGSSEIRVTIRNQYIFLEGTANSDFEADRAVMMAKAYAVRPLSGRRPIERATAGVEAPKGSGLPEVGLGPKRPTTPTETVVWDFQPDRIPVTIVDLMRVRPRPPGKRRN